MVVVISYLEFLMTAEGNHVGYLVIGTAFLLLFGLVFVIFEMMAKPDIWNSINDKVKVCTITGVFVGVMLACITCYNISTIGLKNAEIIKSVNEKIDSGYSVILNQGKHYIFDVTNEYKCDISDLEYFNINVDDEMKKIEFNIKQERKCW